MIITISGKPGSGTTTVSKILKERLKEEDSLDFGFYSIGDMVGELALKHNMDSREFYKQGYYKEEGKKKSLDAYLDDYQKNLIALKDDFVLDSRLGIYWAPDAKSFYFDVDRKVAAQRVFHAHREDEKYISLEDAEKGLKEREKTERDRYWQLYKIKDVHDASNYENVIDTTNISQEKVADMVLDQIKSQVEGRRKRVEEMTSILKGLEGVGLQPKEMKGRTQEIIYCTSPTTSGLVFYNVLLKYDVRNKGELMQIDKDIFKDEVMGANIMYANRFQEKIRKKHPEKTAVNPAKLEYMFRGLDIPKRWEQKDFLWFWTEFIDRFADSGSLNDARRNPWQFSNGSVEEYIFELDKDIPTFDGAGHVIKPKTAKRKVASAIDWIQGKKFDCIKLVALYEELEKRIA